MFSPNFLWLLQLITYSISYVLIPLVVNWYIRLYECLLIFTNNVRLIHVLKYTHTNMLTSQHSREKYCHMSSSPFDGSTASKSFQYVTVTSINLTEC